MTQKTRQIDRKSDDFEAEPEVQPDLENQNSVKQEQQPQTQIKMIDNGFQYENHSDLQQIRETDNQYEQSQFAPNLDENGQIQPENDQLKPFEENTYPVTLNYIEEQQKANTVDLVNNWKNNPTSEVAPSEKSFSEKIKEIQQPYSENTPAQNGSFMPSFDHSNSTQSDNIIVQPQKVLPEMVQPYLGTTVQEHQKAVLPDMVQVYPANTHALENGEIHQNSQAITENLQENSNMVKKRYCCKGCNKKDCGKCNTCLQKPKFGGLGGKGRNNKKCLAKICLKLPESAQNENLQQNSNMVTSNVVNSNMVNSSMANSTMVSSNMDNSNMVNSDRYCCKGCNRRECGKCNTCLQKPRFGGLGGKGTKKRCLAKICQKLPESAQNENLQQNSNVVASNVVNSNMVNSNMVNSNMVNSNMVNSNMVNSSMVNSSMDNSNKVNSTMVMYPKSCKCEGCNRANCGNCNVCYHNHNITIGNSSGNIMRCLAKTCLAKVILEMPKNILETPKDDKEENLQLKPKSPIFPPNCKCEGCKQENCGNCIFCKQKTKFGGDGSGNNQRCLAKFCLEKPQKGRKTYNCEFCDAVFTNKQKQKVHFNTWHPEQKLQPLPKLPKEIVKLSIEDVPKAPFMGFDSNPEVPQMPKTPKGHKPFSCLICGVGLSSKHRVKLHVEKVHKETFIPEKHSQQTVQPVAPVVDINYKEILEMENEQNSNLQDSNGSFIMPNIPQNSQNEENSNLQDSNGSLIMPNIPQNSQNGNISQEITPKLDPFIGFASNQSFEQKPNIVGKVLPEMMNSYSADVTFSSQANDDSLENSSYSELQTTIEKEVKTMKEVPKFQCSICNKVLSSKNALKNHVKNLHKDENFEEAQKDKQQMVEAAPPGLAQSKNSEDKVPWSIDSLIGKQNVEKIQTSNPPGKDILKLF